MGAALFALVDEGGDEFGDLFLLTSRQSRGLLEDLPQSPLRPTLADRRMAIAPAQQRFDAYAEGLCERREDFGAGRFAALLPEGDRLLLDTDTFGEIPLTQPGSGAQFGKVSAEPRTGLRKGSWHAEIIGVISDRPLDGWIFVLHCNKCTCILITSQGVRSVAEDFS